MGGMFLINNDQGLLPIFFANPILSRLHNNRPTDHMTLRKKRGREFFFYKFIFKLKLLGLVSIEILQAIWVTFFRFFYTGHFLTIVEILFTKHVFFSCLKKISLV